MAKDPPAPKDDASTPRTPTVGRFSRFAKLTGMSAGVAARTLGHKLLGTFSDDEDAQRARERRSYEKSARQMTETLGELKGAAMKIGQMLATDPELLPPEVRTQLASLQHSAPPMDAGTVRTVLESSLGQPLSSVFSSFTETPIGSASIGQVHRATTLDGLDVAVKVQYPGIGDTIASDMRNLGAFLVVARAQLPKERLDAYLAEVTSVLERESDYLNEASNLERFQVILKDIEGVRVPIPVHELCRKNVLVMEFFDGTRLETWLTDAPPADRQAQAERLVRAYLRMIHHHGALHADPHPGNFLVLRSSTETTLPPIGVLDLGCVRDYPLTFLDDMLRFLATLWTHDIKALQVLWRKLGFIDDGVDPELIYEWLILMLGPFVENRVTDFGAWRVQDKLMRFVLDNPTIKLWAPPREIVFYTRVLVGIRGMMQKAGLKLNAYELARQTCRERGILP